MGDAPNKISYIIQYWISLRTFLSMLERFIPNRWFGKGRFPIHPLPSVHRAGPKLILPSTLPKLWNAGLSKVWELRPRALSGKTEVQVQVLKYDPHFQSEVREIPPFQGHYKADRLPTIEGQKQGVCLYTSGSHTLSSSHTNQIQGPVQDCGVKPEPCEFLPPERLNYIWSRKGKEHHLWTVSPCFSRWHPVLP